MSEDQPTYALGGIEPPAPPWEPGTTVESIRADLVARQSNYILLERVDPYGYAAYLLADRDTAPGVRALQAGWEEGQVWRSLALAILPSPFRAALTRLATLSVDGDWVVATAFYGTHWEYADKYFIEIPQMHKLGLIEIESPFNGESAYRLTPFGQAVAAALAGEGKP